MIRKNKEKYTVVCAGLAAWDYIGRSNSNIVTGDDIPGEILVKPGGVAVNIALALKKLINEQIVLLSAVGNDDESGRLVRKLVQNGINCDYLTKQSGKCDKYVAIESNGVLHGAIAQGTQLENAGIKIFQPLVDSKLENLKAPFRRVIVLDGNLSVETIDFVKKSNIFDSSQLVIASASPAKTEHLLELTKKRPCTFYMNLHEATAMAKKCFRNSIEAANHFFTEGVARVIVTDGIKKASSCCKMGLFSIMPVQLENTLITGTGDIFLAAHLSSLLTNDLLCPSVHLKVAEATTRNQIKMTTQLNTELN